MSATIDNLEIIEYNQEIVRIRNSSAIIQREALNGFIFCMSLVRKMRDAKEIFPDYDDCWYMTASKAEGLAIILSSLLRERIMSGRNSDNHIVDPAIPLENLSVHCRHDAVLYLDREVHISNTGALTVEQFMHKIRDMAFTKPLSFAREKEFRFSFTILAGNRILTPIVDNVILDGEELTDWLI